MPTQRKKEQFLDHLNDEVTIEYSKEVFSNTISWMKDNLEPDDIFEDDTLRQYVSRTSLPEDVFEDKKLSEWAESNGYKKEE